jgi:hypothetical protein
LRLLLVIADLALESRRLALFYSPFTLSPAPPKRTADARGMSEVYSI